MSRFSEALISRFVVRGFRSLEKVGVDLESVTVLAGPNGSGKSTFVDALAFLQEALSKSPQEAFKNRGGFDQVLTLTGHRPDTISLEVQIQSRAPAAFAGHYFVKFGRKERPRRLIVAEERCEILLGPDRIAHRYQVEDGVWTASAGGIEPRLAEGRLALPLMTSLESFAPLYNALTSVRIYHVSADTLRAWQIPDRGTQLLVDGSNAASVLKRLHENDLLSYERVIQAISTIVPSIQKVDSITRGHGREIALAFGESFVGHRDISFQADSMSDGTLHVLAILAAAYQEQPPVLIAFEEPEATVHPGAAAVLAEALQEAGLRTQVLITTHSPDLLSRFETAQLRAVERAPDGTTMIAPIVGSQQDAIRRRLFTAGELHRIEGLRPAQPVAEE